MPHSGSDSWNSPWNKHKTHPPGIGNSWSAQGALKSPRARLTSAAPAQHGPRLCLCECVGGVQYEVTHTHARAESLQASRECRCYNHGGDSQSISQHSSPLSLGLASSRLLRPAGANHACAMIDVMMSSPLPGNNSHELCKQADFFPVSRVCEFLVQIHICDCQSLGLRLHTTSRS